MTRMSRFASGAAARQILGIAVLVQFGACGGGGDSAPPPNQGTPKPTITLTVSPNKVLPGAPVEVTWSSSNASGCTASGGWSGALPFNGTQTLTTLLSSSTLVLRCDGQGGSASSSVNVTVLPASTASLVELATTIPFAGRQLVTRLITVTDSSKVGEAIDVGPVAEGRLVLGTNAAEEFVVGGFASQGTTRMDSTSTAVVLVRLAMGVWDPEQLPASVANGLIQMAPTFGLLTSAVEAAWAEGKAPHSSQDVVNQVLAVTAWATPELRRETLNATSRAKPRAIPSAKIVRDLDFTPDLIIGSSYALGVSIEDRVDGGSVTGPAGVSVVNSTGLDWAVATSTTETGIGNVSPEVSLDGVDLLLLTPLEPLSEFVDLRGADPSYYVTVRQTNTTRAANISEAVVELILFASAKGISDRGCVREAVVALQNGLYRPIEILMQGGDVSRTEIVDFIIDVLGVGIEADGGQFYRIMSTCGRVPLARGIVKSLAGPVGVLLKAISTSNIGAKVVQAVYWINEDVRIRVCQKGMRYVNCKPSVRVETRMPPGWTDGSYGLWGVAHFGAEGVQCIRMTGAFRLIVYNSNGSVGRDTTFPPSSNLECVPGDLGWWPERSDGDHWGLLNSGGVTNGGRMELTGWWELSLPYSADPEASSARRYNFQCAVSDFWNCSAVPVVQSPPPVEPPPPLP